MTLPIKKIINIKLFTERTAALYMATTQIRVLTNEGGQQVGTSVCFIPFYQSVLL